MGDGHRRTQTQPGYVFNKQLRHRLQAGQLLCPTSLTAPAFWVKEGGRYSSRPIWCHSRSGHDVQQDHDDADDDHIWS